ncbi:MAG: 3D domain-containing protein [Bacilli bacterium]
MKKFLLAMSMRFLVISLFAMLLIIMASGNKHETVMAYNTNRTKSVEAIHIVEKYNNILEDTRPVLVNNMSEVALFGSSKPVKFIGTITGYGPDCVGCGGKVGCPPRQNVKNGNIYFQDADYGKIRIVATDASIPCGSIIKISNLSISKEPIIAIALDRGSAIQGKIMDLLFESERATESFGRQYNIGFEIIRWGW